MRLLSRAASTRWKADTEATGVTLPYKDPPVSAYLAFLLVQDAKGRGVNRED